MSLNLDTFVDFFFRYSTPQVIVMIMASVGWLVLFALLLKVGLHLLEEYKQEKFIHNWQWVLLAVDIPPLNVQTPKAVEQLFAHLAGAFDSPNFADRFRHGYKQRWFSFEIISIEGYIQFLVRTETIFRDLVEAAIYAQYPEAEITEVEDYTIGIPDNFPNASHDIWAADFGLAEGDALPLRTYREFEHSISKDTVLKDPMGTFLESFTRIGPGEQMWFQILLEPISSHWKEKVIKQIKKIIKEKEESGGGGIIGRLTDNFLTKEIGAGFNEINNQLAGYASEPAAEAGGDDHGEPNQLRYLTPGQAKIVEAMGEKMAKVGLKTKMRGIYLARKEVFRPTRGVQAMLGALNQFNIPSANSLVSTFGISTAYFFKERRAAYRKSLLMKAYKKRKLKAGGNPFILNIEELATVWHFPMSHVKTPLLQKAEGKRAEPPAGLPIEGIAGGVPAPAAPDKAKPFIRTDAGDVVYGGGRFG